MQFNTVLRRRLTHSSDHPAVSLRARAGAGASELVFVGLVVGAVCWPQDADASGFAAARFGGEHGHVTTTNPTALYYNPAGISFSEGTHLFLDGTVAIRRVTWEHTSDVEVPPGAENANSGKAELLNVFGGPMAGATTRLGNLALGLSFSVPFGGRAEWSKNERFVDHADFPLAADGVQRWHGTDAALTVLYFTAGAGYRIGPLAVGLAGNLIHTSVSTLRAENPVGSGDPNPGSEGRSDLNVSGFQFSLGAGAMLEVIEDQLWLGASYQAQPGFGPMQLEGTLEISFRGSTLPYDVTFDQALPDIIRLGSRYRPMPDLELRLFGDITRWSVMRTQCVAIEGYECIVDESGADVGGGTLENLRRYWNDTYGIRAGVSYWFQPELEVFAGTGVETAAVPDRTLDPALPDAVNVAGALGARVELVPTLFLAGSYTHIQYLDRDNTGESELTDAAVPTRRADGGGRYTQWIGVANVNVEKEF